MAINYDKYLQIFADACKQVYAEMARKQTDSYIVQASKTMDNGHYAAGIAVPYEDWKEKLAGQLFLGLTDKKKAVHLAAALTADKGSPGASELDPSALAILNKFMCAVVGRAADEWDGLGLATKFDPPLTLASRKIIKTPPSMRETHMVTLRVAGESIAMFVTFEEFAETALTGKKVLIVDDSRTIRKVLARALNKHGCTVVEAVDGRDAIDKFQAENPELTITDMVMPNMGGLEAIGAIRKLSPQAKVLVLTSTADKKEVIAAASLGIRGYVKKPVKPEKLIEAAIGCF
jgi:two-component system chemotaxis response regulator CheY